MVRSLLALGSAVIEVNGDVLTGKFVGDTGAVLDTFEIDKGGLGLPRQSTSLVYRSGQGRPQAGEEADSRPRRDPLALRGCLRRIRMRTGNPGAVTVVARGANAGVPTLPLTLPATAQLVNADTGACWTTDFAMSRRNDVKRFFAVQP